MKPTLPSKPSSSSINGAPLPMLPTKKSKPMLPARPQSSIMSPLPPPKPKKKTSALPLPIGHNEEDLEMNNQPDQAAEIVVLLEKEKEAEEKKEEEEAEEEQRKETVAEKRRKIVGEMQDTESYYTDCLEILVNSYLHPLLQLAETELMPTRTKAEIHQIFANIEQILPINKHLLQALTERIETWNETSLIGDIFLKMAPFFKMYNEYGNNYEKAVDVLTRCQVDAAFNDAIERIATSLDSVGLESLLIMPVQRIPRYNLLLRDLLRKTGEDHPDHSNLTEALHQFENVMEYLDKNITEAENMKKFLAMSKMKGGNRLIQAHRVLVCEAVWNLKPEDTAKKSKLMTKFKNDKLEKLSEEKLKVWLFNDVLVHLKTSKSSKKTDVASTEYTWPLELIWLKDIEEEDPTDKMPYQFILVGPRKTYTLRFPTMGEKSKWMGEMKTAINKVLNEKIAPDEYRRYGQYKFPKEGGQYDGWWKFGRIHGNGMFEFFGNKYKGEWEYNSKCGIGTLDTVSGEQYYGEWKEDKPHGFGTFVYTDDSKYEGQWFEGQRHGKGILEYASGDCYDGEWANNVPSGDGKYTTKTGFMYFGSWLNGLPHGFGELKSPNGRTYQGAFRNGRKHGAGLLNYANSCVYTGLWRDDKRDGFGVFSSKVEGIYEGTWDNDRKHGTMGKLIYPNGSSYIGGWKRNSFNGLGVYNSVDGPLARYDGYWDKGNFWNKGIIYWRNGCKYEGQVKDSLMHGNGVYTSKNSVIIESKWVAGNKDGKSVLSVGPSRFSASIHAGMMADGEKSFLVVPDVPPIHIKHT